MRWCLGKKRERRSKEGAETGEDITARGQAVWSVLEQGEEKVGGKFWGKLSLAPPPNHLPRPPERGRVEEKPEDTPPSSRFWMELEGGAEPRTGRRKEAEPRLI